MEAAYDQDEVEEDTHPTIQCRRCRKVLSAPFQDEDSLILCPCGQINKQIGRKSGQVNKV